MNTFTWPEMSRDIDFCRTVVAWRVQPRASPIPRSVSTYAMTTDCRTSYMQGLSQAVILALLFLWPHIIL